MPHPTKTAQPALTAAEARAQAAAEGLALVEADNKTGFAGVYALAATSSGGYAKKKRFICHEATGAFFTPEEAALERAKSIAKKQKT